MHVVLVTALCVFAAFYHECGHLAAASLLGVKVKRIGIHWRGFYYVREKGTEWENSTIATAGPLVNLLMAAAFADTEFGRVSLLVGLFSLLPTKHADGSRIFSTATELRVK